MHAWMCMCPPQTTVCTWKSEYSLQETTFYHVGSRDRTQAIMLDFNLLSHLAGPSLAYF